MLLLTYVAGGVSTRYDTPFPCTSEAEMSKPMPGLFPPLSKAESSLCRPTE